MWEMNKYGPINQNYLPNCLVEVQALNPYFPGDRTTVYIGGGTFDDYKNNAIAQLEGGTATLTMEIKDVFPWENS
jgi:hypothetical protein